MKKVVLITTGECEQRALGASLKRYFPDAGFEPAAETGGMQSIGVAPTAELRGPDPKKVRLTENWEELSPPESVDVRPGDTITRVAGRAVDPSEDYPVLDAAAHRFGMDVPVSRLPTAAEIADPRTVSAQTFVGDLGSQIGSPLATYAAIGSASNQWSVSCNGGSSRDIAYVWRVPETGSYSIGTSGSNFDTVLQIRNYKATSEIMGCNDDVGSGLTSRVTLTGLVRGTTLLIIIEGYAAEYGTLARLNIIKN